MNEKNARVLETGSATFLVDIEWTTILVHDCYGYGRVHTDKYRVRTATFVTLFKMYDSVSTRVGRLALTLDIPSNRTVFKLYRRVSSTLVSVCLLMTLLEVDILRDTVLEVSAWTTSEDTNVG